jgi:ribA/ribD-fused uncharacterized protein
MRETNKKTKQTTVSEIDAIKCILPRDLHIGDEAFSKIEIGDTVHVEIKKSRFQVNDKFILSVGIFQGKTGSDYVAPALEEKEDEVEDEKGPTGEAEAGLRRFEEEAAKRRVEEGVVLEDELPPLEPATGPSKPEVAARGYRTEMGVGPEGNLSLPYASGEPIYFNAAKNKEYREFDNRFPAKFSLDGSEWPTVEHYYQAMKFPEFPAFQEEIRQAATASAAAKLGKKKDPSKPIRADWKEQRELIMRKAIFSKFDQNPALKKLLLDTYPRPLIFADSNDAFWGYGQTQQGQNKLGQTLMDYRSTHTGMEALNG